MGIIFVLSIGSFFIYKYIKSKNALPKHLQTTQKTAEKQSSFTVYDLKAKAITLSSLKNKVVLINFWATWCAPCIKELPSLNTLAKHYLKDLVILAVSNEDTQEIYNFLMAFPKFYTNFIPANIDRDTMLSYFPVRAFPETYLLDKKGNIVDKIIGQQQWDTPKWKNKIKALIEQSNNPVPF